MKGETEIRDEFETLEREFDWRYNNWGGADFRSYAELLGYIRGLGWALGDEDFAPSSWVGIQHEDEDDNE